LEHLERLVRELAQLPAETAWVEFKENMADPKTIGKNISALANAAALYEKNQAYMIWGIHNATHAITGTVFDYRTCRIGNEELFNWLLRLLSDNAHFEFSSISVDGKPLVVLSIGKAFEKTVMFEKTEYIRVGSYTKKLNDYPELKTQLWDCLRNTRFESLFAKTNLQAAEVLALLNYPAYFDLRNAPLPSGPDGILHYLLEEGILVKQDNGLFSITNLGAILFAKKLDDFSSVKRKALRIVQYKGKDKLEMLREHTVTKGYASGFEGMLEYVESLLPASEVIRAALRETVTAYPSLAVRETIGNALIHQDLAATGTGPVVEVFSNRIEITNPGVPLIDVARIIDNPPKSRNEQLASLMRRLRICEELGTGWDKIVISCEQYQLPAPRIDVYEDSAKVTLYAHQSFGEMSQEDRIRACYQHASLKQVCGEQMNNASLRERFGLESTASAQISRLIRDTQNAGLIRPYDPDTAPKHMRYVPYWA